jgi:hypothetical protein
MVETTERINTTIWDAFSYTGGIMGFIFIAVDVLIGGL